MKRTSEEPPGGPAQKRPGGGGGGGEGHSQMALKLLFSQKEAAEVLQGEGDGTLHLLERVTGTTVRLSPEGKPYPGTQMRELAISGATVDAVLNAVALIQSQVTGSLATGDEAATVRVLVPSAAAGGLGSLQEIQNSGVQCHVATTRMPPGEETELSEQLVSLTGPSSGMQSALRAVAAPVAQLLSRSWFPRWAGHSYCGLQASAMGGAESTALSLAIAMPQTTDSHAPGLVGFGLGAGGLRGPMVLKLLLSMQEASVLRAQDGAFMVSIQNATGTQLFLTKEGQVYPGTSLQEIVISGQAEAAVAGAVEALRQVVEAVGALNGGDAAIGTGTAKLKIIIPQRATAAVIGPGGKIVAQMRSQTHMHVHVETIVIPPGPLTEVSEQVVCFDGPLTGVQPALLCVAEVLLPFTTEPWFIAWALNSYSGMAIPGVALFQDDKGKGKAKGFGKGPGSLTMKLLLPPNEASCVLGKGGSTVREIAQITGTKVVCSAKNEYYPQTQLQEVKAQGGSQETVIMACGQILSKIAELTGSVSGGEAGVEPGGCRLKLVMPFLAAAAVATDQGGIVQVIREKSGLTIRVEESTTPPGPPSELSEQIVSLSGPLGGVLTAITLLAELLVQFSCETWFETWATASHCGYQAPSIPPYPWPGGKSKSKGGTFHSAQSGGGGGGGYTQIPAGVLAALGKQAEAPHVVAPLGSGGGHHNHHQQSATVPLLASTPPSTSTGTMALKVLISLEDVGVLGQDPTTMMQIQQATGTIGMLSEKHYPGTTLQELTVQGSSAESVFNAVLLILNKIAEVVGCVSSGEMNVPAGEARIKVVVPKRAAAAIIGPGGATVRAIKSQTGIRVHVDGASIPCGDKVFEQAVCLSGPISGMQVALSQVVTEVANFTSEAWFADWSAHSNTGQVIPGLVLFESMNNKGKGKGFA